MRKLGMRFERMTQSRGIPVVRYASLAAVFEEMLPATKPANT
jgi:hypothetical protein